MVKIAGFPFILVVCIWSSNCNISFKYPLSPLFPISISSKITPFCFFPIKVKILVSVSK